MRTPVRYALLLVALIAAAAPFVRAADEPELEGMYAVSGVNPDGNEYRGVVQIEHHGDSLRLTWMFPDVSPDTKAEVLLIPNAVGIGIVNGGMLAVSYYGPRLVGIVLYRIEENGHRLAGQWTVVGDDGALHAETLTRLPPEAVQPRRHPDTPSEPTKPVRLPAGQV
jgi:hypothetical protein